MNVNDIDLRKAVLTNLNDSNASDLQSVIVDAIESGEEKTLLGLGVLFELLWRNSSQVEQQDIVQSVHAEIQKASPGK
jgi:small acid-soluble spore protein I (minor)